MDISAILENDGYHAKNPNYRKGNGQPEFIITDDPKYAPKTTADLFMQAAQRGELGSLGEASDFRRYIRGGITPSAVDDISTYEAILANHQSTWEKWKNAFDQTVINEILLGTIKGFADLADIISGAAFRSDNDYSNPVSRYLEELQESFKENHPIYVDPNKDIAHGGLGDAGWWASNVPSIASTITLLIPAGAATKGVSMIGKGAKAVTSGTKAYRRLKTLEKAWGLGKNTERGIAARRIFENGVSALTMRTIENYQEGRQVYDDVYKQSSETLNSMNNEEYQNFIKRNSKELEGYNIDLNNRDAVARQMAHNAANKTFISDYQNLIWDVIQINALRNPLKYEKNMRRTASVNRTQRERIINTMKSAGVAVDEPAKKSMLKGVGNWFRDRAGAGFIVTSELSEGVEEAVNYIAQQEGMHYANVMLGTEDDNSFGDRFWSYLGNGDLYDAAFWGVLGGVGFQAGGSGINRVVNLSKANIRERRENKESINTKEKVNTNWSEKYRTTEDKYRTKNMEDAVIQFNDLKDKLNILKDHKDPYNLERTLTPEEEKDARQRVIDEYLTNLAFSSIDSGTWDLTKDYLRDEGVQEALKQVGVIDSESGDVESMIAFMDKIEKDYNNNIKLVSDLASKSDTIPFEYIQIIARNNTKAQQRIERLDKKIKEYALKGEEDFNLFKDNLDKDIDYKSAVELAVTATRIGQLNALKKEINSNKQVRESVDGRQQLNSIDKELNILYNRAIELAGENQTDQLSNLMYIIGHASQQEHDNTRGFYTNRTSDEYLSFIQNVAKGDLNSILKDKQIELGNRNFETTDERIVSLFGNFANKDYNGKYQARKSVMDAVMDESNGLRKRSKALFDDYSALAWLELGKISMLSKMATTTESANAEVNTLHNYMNQARVNAIQQAHETINELGKKYGYDTMMSNIFSNVAIDNIEDADKTKLADALEVLHLTSESNAGLAQNIKAELLKATIDAELEEAAKDAKPGESSSTSQKPISDEQKQGRDNSSPQGQNARREVENGQNDENTPQNQSANPLNDSRLNGKAKAIINIDTDGNINVNAVEENDEQFGFKYATAKNGDVMLDAEQANNIPNDILAKEELFEGYNPNNPNKPTVTKNPVIARYSNDNWYVKEKGKLTYPTANTFSTGEAPQAKTKKADEIEYVPEITIKDTEAEQNRLIADLKARIKKDFAEAGDNITEEDVARIFANIKSAFEGKYDLDAKEFESTINRNHRIKLKTLKANGLLKSSGDVLMSTIIEENGRFKFGDDYTKAVDKMVQDYSKEFNLDKIDGKYYISLEDLLRRINYLYDDKTIAASMFGAMVAYMQSSDGKGKYVITDANINSALENAAVSAGDRRKELMGDNSSHRVSIDKYFDANTDTFKKAYASLREGDVLKYEVGNGRLYLKKNNVVIGELPYPYVEENTGALWKENMGWIEKVWYNSATGKVESNLSSFYEAVLNHSDDITKQLYNNILKLNNETLSNKDKSKLINETKELIDKVANSIYKKSSEVIKKDATDEDVVNHFANIIKYFNNPVDPSLIELWTKESVNEWFEKLYNSYKAIDNLKQSIDNGKVEIKVNKITSGELIRNINTNDVTNYDKLTQSNEAFTKEAEPAIGIVSPTNENLFVGSEKEISLSVQVPDRRKGNVYIVLKKNNRDSKGDYERENADFVIATGVKMSDANVKGDVKRVFNAVKKEIDYLIDEYSKNPSKENYDKLNNFLHDTFYNTWSNGTTYGVQPNTGIVFGVNYKYFDRDGVLELESSDKSIAIQINTGKTLTNDDLTTTTSYFGIKVGKNNKFQTLQNNSAAVKQLKEVLNKLYDKAQFNIALNHINGDRDSSLPNGLITRNAKTRQITITIPNSKTGKPFVRHYNSFNELVIKGGFVKVNTHVENGNNYRYKGDNQKANRTLQVTIKTSSTSPVRSIETKTVTTPQSTKTDIKTAFKDNVASIDDILAVANIPTETINLLKDLQLLPKNIIFAENLNAGKYEDSKGVERWAGVNAHFDNKTKQVVVGNKWVDMFNETNEFALGINGESRKQAIRKLIHEQLHAKLHSDENTRVEYLNKVKEVYDEFAKSLENVDKDNHIRQYLFSDEEGDRKYEEFLVESLTSKELADYLNNVKTNEENKSLFDKIINFIKQILGLDVNKGSLLEKQLNNIQSLFGAIETKVETKETTKEENKIRRRKSKEIDNKKDILTSTIVENTKQYPSFMDFANITDNPAQTIRAAENGNINIRCK